MGDLDVSDDFWSGRRVFLTGHTGFKGSWLALWLARKGALVTGYALDPDQEQGLFVTAGVAGYLDGDHRADIRDRDRFSAALAAAEPEVVFHLAAQPLVRDGYAFPIETYETNVIGTANMLQAAQQAGSVQAVVNITTDKCYENREWVHPYRENDRLGGHDPYSSSKACAELLTASWRQSYPQAPKLASVRAGNVIGGGDWAEGRLVPDCVRAFSSGEDVVLRRPDALRPWQHVLEPLRGYMMVARRLIEEPMGGYDAAWNFGPDTAETFSVLDVARSCGAHWGEGARVRVDAASSDLHEAGLLKLDSSRAQARLGWRPLWGFEDTMRQTLAWYRQWHGTRTKGGAFMQGFTLDQISAFETACAGGGS